MEPDRVSVPHYDKADRGHLRRLMQKASRLIDLIAEDRVPLGSPLSAELIDRLTDGIGYDDQKDEEALQELRDDRYSVINLYGAVKKIPAFLPLYVQLGALLRKYGLFEEEVFLLENAAAGGGFSEEDLIRVKERLSDAQRLREKDDAGLSDAERTAADLRRALRKKPLDGTEIRAALDRCTDDAMLYDVACNTDADPAMVPIREKAARLLRSRDYRYALSSHLQHKARTAMILDLYDSLEGDAAFIARTILTDPRDDNKAHMLLFCKDEALLMLGWRHVYGAKQICADRLHRAGSRFPEAYGEMDPQERTRCEQEWLAHAAELARELLDEDEAVSERLSGGASVDSEPLHFFLSFHHPRLALRWWHARKLENPARIAYVGSWTSDDQIKESLAVKINSTVVITEMIFGDLSAADLVFAFDKPGDLTLQDRFCAEILKNNPDRTIREHVRKELLRGNTGIPGVDLTEPDPLFHKG